jgi:hypothetical protein
MLTPADSARHAPLNHRAGAVDSWSLTIPRHAEQFFLEFSFCRNYHRRCHLSIEAR